MKTRDMIITTLLMFALISSSTFAQNYHLLKSVTGSGGGRATSTNYTVTSTLGQPAPGPQNGTAYNGVLGFWGQYESLLDYFYPKIAVNSGWNLLSVSRTEPDYRKLILYATSISNAFEFVTGSGYAARDTLRNGVGFWLKFASAETLRVSALVRLNDTVNVQAGWNIVGGTSLPIDTSTITSDPPGIRSSPWYGYVAGYQPAPVLEPGKGYWIKASSAGSFIFSSSLDAPARPMKKQEPDQSPAKDEFIVAEKDGGLKSIYIEAEATTDGAMSELPPTAPEGAFDVRFASHKSIEVAGVAKTIMMQSSKYPLTFRWSIKGDAEYTLKDGVTGTLLKSRHISKTGELVITNPEITRLILTKEQSIPHEFALFQNYPNPFNPTTQVKFSVAVAGLARVEMFNVLGQRVQTLFNENAEPGRYYTLHVDGATMASGVYFYRLQSGARLDTRKMVLLK